MKLENKKSLAARTLKVGKNRISFNRENLAEIKEAITRQDIRDLVSSKAIFIDEKKGKRTIKKRKTRKKAGSVKKKVNQRKRDYMIITRKLRAYISMLKNKGYMTREDYLLFRKEIRAKQFRSKSHLRERIANLHTE